MPRNKLNDLNDHLFTQLEKLSDDSLEGEQLKQELDRAKGMSMLATNIIESAKTTVTAYRMLDKGITKPKNFSFLLTDKGD